MDRGAGRLGSGPSFDALGNLKPAPAPSAPPGGGGGLVTHTHTPLPPGSALPASPHIQLQVPAPQNQPSAQAPAASQGPAPGLRGAEFRFGEGPGAPLQVGGPPTPATRGGGGAGTVGEGAVPSGGQPEHNSLGEQEGAARTRPPHKGDGQFRGSSRDAMEPPPQTAPQRAGGGGRFIYKRERVRLTPGGATCTPPLRTGRPENPPPQGPRMPRGLPGRQGRAEPGPPPHTRGGWGTGPGL